MVTYNVSENRDVYANLVGMSPLNLTGFFRFLIPIKEPCCLNYIDLFLEVKDAECKGTLAVEVRFEGHCVNYEVSLKDIKDNTPLRLTIENHPSVEKVLEIVLKSSSEGKEPPKLWMNKSGPCVRVNGRVDKSYSLSRDPRISIITPVYNTKLAYFGKAAESVTGQQYDNWQWCIADDGSTDKKLLSVLSKLSEDQRIEVSFGKTNRGIGAASNRALAKATGEYVCFLDHDDLLHPEALLEIVSHIDKNPNVKFLYTDEDKIDDEGNHSSVFYKPDWSYYMFLAQMYTCHLSVFQMELLKQTKGFDTNMEGAQDYDLTFRCVEKISDSKDIVHIPRVLYHWRKHGKSTAQDQTSKPSAHLNALRAVQKHLTRTGQTNATVMAGPFPGIRHVRYNLGASPQVTVIVPTRNNALHLRTCLFSILESSYKSINLVVVDNGSTDQHAIDLISHVSKLSRQIRGEALTLKYDAPFNFSAINNYALVNSPDTPYVLFLNDDIEAVSPNWIEELLQYAKRDNVGAVGAKLLYPDSRIQHAGVIIGIGGIAGHSHKYVPNGACGYFSRPHIVQNVSAVTGACMMVRRETFPGFDENLPKAFNDVDVCLKMRQAGQEIIYNPRAVLIHYESASRGKDNSKDKEFADAIRLMQERWNCSGYQDPFYNVNLSLEREDFSYRY